MNHQLSQAQIKSYQENGFVVINDFLNAEELAQWRDSVTEAIGERKGRKLPDRALVGGEDSPQQDADADYFSKVFDQLLNLWQTNDKVKDIMLDERIGKMAVE